MIDPNRIVKETLSRVTKRLGKMQKEEQLVERLTARIQAKLKKAAR